MRTPSRRMPPRLAPSRVGLWILLAVLGAALLSFLWFASTSVIAVVGLACAALWMLSHRELKSHRAQLAAMAAAREGESICQFAQSFDTRQVDTWAIRAVYETLQKELEPAHPAFPVRASDSLGDLLADPDDLDLSVVPEVGRRAGRSLNNIESNPGHGAVKSVRDLVMLFNAQPKAGAPGPQCVPSTD